MSKKDDKDLERPHYYSQFWINIARGGDGSEISLGNGSATHVADRADSYVDDLFPVNDHTASSLDDIDDEPEDDFEDELPLPPQPAPKPNRQRNTPTRSSTLSSFADLAAIGFGAGAETEELSVGADAETDDIISQLESGFDMGRVEPDEEEAASLESLSEEEDEQWDDEEDENKDGIPRRGVRPVVPPKPTRRPAPKRREF